MKNIHNFNDFKYLKINEISTDLRNMTINSMKNKGMIKRADKWEQHYTNEDLKQFIDKEIFEDGEIILSFRLLNSPNRKGEPTKTLEISYGSPRNKEYNKSYGVIHYDMLEDKYYIGEIDRRSARILSKIATIVNPETKYSNGMGDFKIKGWY